MEEEAQLHEATCHTLREAVEEFAEAMLALIAAKELGISRRRGLQFLEAYIGKLYNFEDVSNTTKLETIIYTACGHLTGAHAFCMTCKSVVVKCSIWSVMHSMSLCMLRTHHY
ncbi:uncharacterized protein BJ212DRAFT_1390627 [Suillus subaureus]|uniref:Uncharacterized protein n=1 Tax=Suillus subaureus TaxID=48587 RepID=A0A9P7DXM2_9AGAM|nr:uncharacterized protein BJ212DRAFT_1390627 [Suillus subaureus]KAG1805836.1 hypothetical protein BJ212DRAFT_1390627 [Suillus subaureus]